MIFGLPDADSSDFINYGDTMAIPFVGVGFVARYMSDGVTSYVPYVLPKCRFNVANLEANTQEESLEFQTQSLEATILRDDTTNHNWLKIGEAQTTEALALGKITTFLA